jgi:hypothetical protein
MINQARDSKAFFNAPTNSRVRYQSFDGIDMLNIGQPNLSYTSASSDLPGFIVKGQDREPAAKAAAEIYLTDLDRTP